MPKRQQPQPEGALYVRLPALAVDKLDRAAEALGIHKKDLVAGLVTKYVDPDSKRGLSALGAISQPRRVVAAVGGNKPIMGTYSFQAYDPAPAPEPAPAPQPLPEVLNAAQAAYLLQLDKALVLELAEAGTLPGRKLGPVWRFSQRAVLAWLAAGDSR